MIIGGFFGNLNIQINLAGTETGESLSGLVLGSNSDSVTMDRRPLTSASPMVSGMGRFDEVADVSYKVVVETSEDQTEKVRQILQNMGGTLDNPNVKKQQFKSNSEIIINKTLLETSDFLEHNHSSR